MRYNTILLFPIIQKQLSECSKEESDITVYLMAPIQRIPAYVMCLKVRKRNTSFTLSKSHHLFSFFLFFHDF